MFMGKLLHVYCFDLFCKNIKCSYCVSCYMVINQYRYPKLDGYAIRLVEDSNRLKESNFIIKLAITY